MENQLNGTVIQYNGEINAELCRGLILAVHNHMNNREPDLLTRKRITHIITECLLNLTHHAEIDLQDSSLGKYVEVHIHGNLHQYLIKTRNFVSNKKLNFLTTRLDKINEMNTSELYEHYMNQLQTGQYTNKGTAGLGFIDIARKSGNKLKYFFQQHNNQSSFFSFEITVNKPKTK